MKSKIQALLWAFLAAVFYALNTPASKLLLEKVSPTFMAAFLYLGAGIGVASLWLLRRNKHGGEELLTKADLPYTAGMIVLDIAAPIFLMLGINMGSASGASLLGNFEIVATTLIALLIFRESVSKRLWTAIAFITLASMLLSLEGESGFQLSFGSLFVLLATVCWGLENNCTRKISDKSTYQIVTLKGFFSGGGSFVIALLVGEKLPEAKYAITAMLLGFVAYGLSIFLYIRAQRTLGAAKTSAYYAAAPFIGAALSALLVGEKVNGLYLNALGLMTAGTAFVIWDTMVKHHSHQHQHVVVHTHNGITHTHIITHEHGHSHVSEEGVHEHKHSEQELLHQRHEHY